MGGQWGGGSRGFREEVFGGGKSRGCARGRRRKWFGGERVGLDGESKLGTGVSSSEEGGDLRAGQIECLGGGWEDDPVEVVLEGDCRGIGSDSGILCRGPKVGTDEELPEGDNRNILLRVLVDTPVSLGRSL